MVDMGSMKIGHRLTLAFALILVLLAIVASFALIQFSHMSSVTQSIVDDQMRRVILAGDANAHAQATARRLLELLQTNEPADRIPLYKEMDDARNALDHTADVLAENLTAPEYMTQWATFREKFKRYRDDLQDTVEKIEIESIPAARVHFDSTTRKALDELLNETAKISSVQRDAMDEKLYGVDGLNSREASAQRLVKWISIAAALAGFILAVWIWRSIVPPVRKAVTVAEAIADGNLATDVPQGKADEVGKLLRALTVMRDSIASREEKILRLAYQDPLTGLANRTRFAQSLDELTAHCSGAVAVLDIDRFSLINNALGHAVGDSLLKATALRLASHIDPNGKYLVGRLWGDQFAYFLPDAGESAARAFAEAVVASLKAPMVIDGQRLDVGGSLGIALYPTDGNDASTLLRRAEHAMRSAKRLREDFAFSSQCSAEPAHEQLSLIGEMREALERGEFIAHYQPKFNLASNKVTGTEALLRWQHPTKGLIPPGKFIPFAEKTGFIRDITPWLIELVIRDSAQWRRDGIDVVPSVNLSTHDLLSVDLVRRVDELLKRHGLTPQQLCLEITESALMEDPALAEKHLDDLSALGVKLSIDDYGQGQASLAYIKRLPVNELKIDREFVMDVPVSRENVAIVRSTIVLCHDLDLTVVAEGAETAEEIAWLRTAGCDLIQGYGIARPMPLDRFREWVQQKNAEA